MGLIPLTQGKFAKVSDHWFDFLNQWKWFYHAKGYAARNIRRHGKQHIIFMHLLIHPSPKGLETEHWDGDPLNNQDNNLRIATRSQNMMNQKPQQGRTSKYKGVHWEKDRKKWRARIKVNQKRKHLGRFKIEEYAAKAYDKAALKYFGEFARLNF